MATLQLEDRNMIVDDFQKQIENNATCFTEDELGLFHDSIRCFHAGIYRPAYILAYQSMMVYFRRLLQDAKMPSGYDSGKWKGVQIRLAKDKEWEEEVNNALRTQPDSKSTPPVIALFCMSDSLRKDFDFWRNRRNDCAHYKEYVINDSHVLAFYSFLTQYLLKISVEGGMMTLLNEFKDACDPIKTSPNASLQPLVDKILSMVNPEEMDDFFAHLDGAMGFRYYGRYEQTLADIIKGGNEELKGYAVSFARSNNHVRKGLIDRFPNLVGHLVDKSEAREYWMKHLNDCRNRVAVLAQMIMLGLIDPSEQDEAIRRVIDYSFNNNEGIGEVSVEEMQALKVAGFYKTLKEKYFNGGFTSKNAYNCGKTKYTFFYEYMSHLPVNKEWVEVIVDIFSQADYPTVWRDMFKKYFLKKEEYKAKFDEVVIEYGIKVPDCLKD